MGNRPKVLIEDWLPIETVGAESMRERGAASALPPLNFLHVWWARRPLLTSRASILASLLPSWDENWPESLKTRWPSADAYNEWFLKACGIFGDPVAGRKRIDLAKDAGIRLKGSPYTHDRAFKVSPSKELRSDLEDLMDYVWGTSSPTVMDPMAGGGSIPFEALRYGFPVIANELNPVASVILRATLDFPFRFGDKVRPHLKRYGKELSRTVGDRLLPFYPEEESGSVHAYLWARTVTCPYTGKPIPLSPNWWLEKKAKRVAVQPVFDPASEQATFRILEGKKALTGFDPDDGTVSRGKGISPWAQNQPVDGDHIKAEAQAGRMGQQLFAVAIKKARGFAFRPPRPEDEAAFRRAGEELERRRPEWDRKGLIPTEPYPEVSNDPRPRHYGMPQWKDMFSPRQLLALCTYLDALTEMKPRIVEELGEDLGKAVITYLAIPLDKAADYNSRLCKWDGTRTKITNTFDRHDFSFKWSYGEFDAARNLFPWVHDQVLDAYKGLAKLASGSANPLFGNGDTEQEPVRVLKGSAADLSALADGSVDHVNVDPPYEANVMYAECSDFFYVWMKRSLGDLYPEFFTEELTNKDEEAVANEARFAGLGRKKKQLALRDYERKMASAFREMGRVLRDDGVMTVMFTHKQVDAWDTLATSLIGAGFTIHSSWPVHTESEHSLHQAKKNAARSTILLTCRKREQSQEAVWWDDLKGRVRRVARESAERFEKEGIRGVDLYIATFGPTLSILSENWPVLTSEVDERSGEPKPLRPEVALDLAREEVVNLRRQGLLLGRTIQFDPVTDWMVMAWDAFQAERFPADEARKLALALGLDLDRQIIREKRLVATKGSDVILQQPRARRRGRNVDPDATSFDAWIDAAHTAMLIYKEDGSAACGQFLRDRRFLNEATFRHLIQALVNAIPRTKQKGRFVRPEAEVLEGMRLAFFDDVEAPPEDALLREVQGDLLEV